MDWASSNVAKWLHNPNTMQKNNVHTIEAQFWWRRENNNWILLFIFYFLFVLAGISFLLCCHSIEFEVKIFKFGRHFYSNNYTSIYSRTHTHNGTHTQRHTHTKLSQSITGKRKWMSVSKENTQTFLNEFIPMQQSQQNCALYVCLAVVCRLLTAKITVIFFWLHAFFSVYVVVVRKRCLDFYFQFKMHFSLVFFSNALCVICYGAVCVVFFTFLSFWRCARILSFSSYIYCYIEDFFSTQAFKMKML